MWRHRKSTSAVAAVLVLFCSAFADDKPKATTDPAKADADFAIQGEYVGEVGEGGDAQKFGIQVIALGNGKFRSVAYAGGLPGEGGDSHARMEGDGETKGGVTRFGGGEGSATIQGGEMLLEDQDGNMVGKFPHVLRKSPTEGKKPPEGAIVLFDGKNADRFREGAKLEDGSLVQGATSKDLFQSCTLHLEFRTPYMPEARGQGRGNSGCYFQGRYEVQILDSFGLAGTNHECGGLYEIRDPNQNMCYPPLSWQTYDVDFVAAVFDADGKKTKPAEITVRHNGVLIQENVVLPRTTRAAPVNTEGAEPGPIYLQDHGNPVRFRNIWIVKKG